MEVKRVSKKTLKLKSKTIEQIGGDKKIPVWFVWLPSGEIVYFRAQDKKRAEQVASKIS